MDNQVSSDPDPTVREILVEVFGVRFKVKLTAGQYTPEGQTEPTLYPLIVVTPDLSQPEVVLHQYIQDAALLHRQVMGEALALMTGQTGLVVFLFCDIWEYIDYN